MNDTTEKNTEKAEIEKVEAKEAIERAMPGVKENGGAPKVETLTLSEKQGQLLSNAMQERSQLEMHLKKAQQKESDIGSLILDAHDVDIANVLGVNLEEDGITLTVNIK